MLRGLGWFKPAEIGLAPWQVATPWAAPFAIVLALLGITLLAGAAGIAAGQAWGWLVGAPAASTGVVLVIAAAWLGAGPDWAAAGLCGSAALALAAPSARALCLGEESPGQNEEGHR